MKSYLDDIKKMYSNSEEIVIVFKDKQLVWTNKTKKFFNGQFPSYFEFVNGNFQQLPNVKFCCVRLKIGNDIFNGTFMETVENDSTYSTFVEKVKNNNVCDDVVVDIKRDSQKDIEHEMLIQWIKTMNTTLSIVITNFTALLEQQESEETINHSYVNNIIEHLRCILFFCNFGMLIINTAKGSEEYSDRKLNNLITFIPKMASRINNDFNINIECDFKTEKSSRVFSLCNSEELKKLVLYSLKYILLLSGSDKVDISHNELNEECEIIINAHKADICFSVINDMQQKMIEPAINRYCEHMGVICSEKEDNKTVSLILKFNTNPNINIDKFESNFDDIQQS
ncbi:MAG: hypothetical protein K2G63_03045, partial [Oscillospiraceae bacterium]|nr:hypothetical protein [Oscillospiraceae bacterium]